MGSVLQVPDPHSALPLTQEVCYPGAVLGGGEGDTGEGKLHTQQYFHMNYRQLGGKKCLGKEKQRKG